MVKSKIAEMRAAGISLSTTAHAMLHKLVSCHSLHVACLCVAVVGMNKVTLCMDLSEEIVAKIPTNSPAVLRCRCAV